MSHQDLHFLLGIATLLELVHCCCKHHAWACVPHDAVLKAHPSCLCAQTLHHLLLSASALPGRVCRNAMTADTWMSEVQLHSDDVCCSCRQPSALGPSAPMQGSSLLIKVRAHQQGTISRTVRGQKRIPSCIQWGRIRISWAGSREVLRYCCS